MNEDDRDDELDREGEAQQPTWPMVIPLSKEIRDKDAKPTKQLTLREPTAGDIETCGNPVKLNPFNPDETSFDAKAMTAMISLLSTTPMRFVRDLSPGDWNGIAWRLFPFFLPDMGRTTSSTPTGSPSSTG